MRTVQAFTRYDTDGSGAIDIDEMRDALRKLGVKAGSLEESQLFRKYEDARRRLAKDCLHRRLLLSLFSLALFPSLFLTRTPHPPPPLRYDADGSGTIELCEFATLVRDLQLYATYDTNFDGRLRPSKSAQPPSTLLHTGLSHARASVPTRVKIGATCALIAPHARCCGAGGIDVDELHNCLDQIGVRTSKEETLSVFRAATGGGDTVGSVTGAMSADLDALSMSVFTNLVADLRTFRQTDADGDGLLTRPEVSTALTALGVAHNPTNLDTMLTSAHFGDRLGMAEFVKVVRRHADEQSMRRHKEGGASALVVGPHDVLNSTFNKKMLQA